MGDFPHSEESRLIGYAISSTPQSISMMEEEQIQKIVRRFSALSFREYNIAKQISSICKKFYRDCVDPDFKPVIPSIDYSNMQNLLFQYRKSSIDFIKNALS